MKPDDLRHCRFAGNVIDIVSLLMLQAWRDRNKPIAHREGDLIVLPPRLDPNTPTRRIA